MSVTSLTGRLALLATPLLRGSAPRLAWTRFASKQVKGEPEGRSPKAKVTRQEVALRQGMTVAALARAMNRDVEHVLEALRHTPLDPDSLDPDSVLDQRWMKEAVTRSGMKVRWAAAAAAEPRQRENRDAAPRPRPPPAALVRRPPVVTIMGHVDHGKTTLLDSLRRSQLAAAEAGGITQHIGAFAVQLPTGETITFLDTPGHAAFSAMRARGADATDIIVLVVAADDGVMKQTAESIEHAKRARVPVIVAVNKCDKPHADPGRVAKQLLAHDLVCEEFGGDVQVVHVSALKGDNLMALAEATVALAEVLELKAAPDGPVEGLVIESCNDKGRGPMTTAVVQQGTLRRGGVLVAGRTWAKVRFLLDENGRALQEAGPGTAAQVVGWKELPAAGDAILEVESEQRAREVVAWRRQEEELHKLEDEQSAIEDKQRRHLETYRKERAELAHLTWRQRKSHLYKVNRSKFALRPSERGGADELSLPLVVKGDVDGTLEAILNILDGYDAQHQCRLDVVHCGVGDVSENDVNMADTFSGSIYGLNVAASRSAQQAARRRGVPLRLHAVIYQLVEQLKDDLSDRLPPLVRRVAVGEASVLAVFDVTVGKKKVEVAGCRVTRGLLDRRLRFRLLRGGTQIWEGSLAALKHHKDEVPTVRAGMDCGLSAEQEVAFQAGDVIECFEETESRQVTAWDPGF